MNIDVTGVIIGLIQLFVSLLTGIFFLYASYLFFKVLTTKIDDLKELKNKNTAMAIFMGSTIFAVSWIAKYSVQTGMDGIAMVMRNPKPGYISLYLFTGGIFLLQIVVAGITAFAGIWIAVRMFIMLTKNIDEISEIKQNNVAVAIILSVVIISVALFIEPAIEQLMKSLIPYPDINIIPRIK